MSDAKQARSLFGRFGVDFEERVNFERLRRERLKRLQNAIKKSEFGAVVVFDPVNIRYATGTRFGGAGLIARKFLRYAVVPGEGEPILYEYYFAVPHARLLMKNVEPSRGWWYFYAGKKADILARDWARNLRKTLTKVGVEKKAKIGIDKLDVQGFKALGEEGFHFDDCAGIMETTRAVKTKDELELIKSSCAVADVAIERMREAIKPGVTEYELFAILAGENLKHGGEHMELKLLASGARTNPWFQEATDKIVRNGELVAFDTDMAGPMGYVADVSRTYLCGNGRGTKEQRETYNLAYDFIQDVMKTVKAGVSFRTIAEKAPSLPQAYKKNRYVAIIHGVGLEDEWPIVHFPDIRENYEGKLEENMIICVEAYLGKENGIDGVKLEEQGIVTSSGYHVISTAPFDEKLLD